MERELVPSISCRKLISIEPNVTGPRISIAQYNILADAAIPSDNAGFDICGSYKFCPSEYRYMDYRHEKIIQEMKCLNADIVTVQEIEAQHFYGKFKQDMSDLGYGSVSHTRFFDHIGMAIFYNKEKLRLRTDHQFIIHQRLGHHLKSAGLDKETYDELVDHLIICSTYPGIIQPPGCIIANFELRSSGQPFCIATTHITWKEMKYPSMQMLQIYAVLQELHCFARGQPCLIAADFNAESCSTMYKMLSSGLICQDIVNMLLSDQHFLDVHKKINGQKMTDLLQTLSLPSKLTSCYLKVQSHEPAITNIDESVTSADQDGLYEACLDYIWCDSNFHPVTVLQEPEREVLVKHGGIPSKVFPSDHIPIYCEVILAESI